MTKKNQNRNKFHQIFVSRDTTIPETGLLTQAQSESFVCMQSGKMPKAKALAIADTYLDIEGNTQVRVFVGLGVGKLVAEKRFATRMSERLEALRSALRAENMSYGEIVELQSLAEYIKPGDVELLEAAGVPEFPE